MDYRIKEFCKLITEFALEYKTVRDRLLQQQEKQANHRDRNKTRGKLITESGRYGKVDLVDTLIPKTAVNDDNKMIEEINKIDYKSGGIYNTYGPRTRTRLSTDRASTSSPINGGLSGAHSVNKLVTDTEDDENKSLDRLVLSTLTAPKGQPPKKRTKKYGERKSFRRTLNLNEDNDDK
jgi:hypothetical protein